VQLVQLVRKGPQAQKVPTVTQVLKVPRVLRVLLVPLENTDTRAIMVLPVPLVPRDLMVLLVPKAMSEHTVVLVPLVLKALLEKPGPLVQLVITVSQDLPVTQVKTENQDLKVQKETMVILVQMVPPVPPESLVLEGTTVNMAQLVLLVKEDTMVTMVLLDP